MYGKDFSDFVNDTVVPYVQKNYNVYADAAHSSICGSSLGGLESFYIGMEHPETFGTVGALSSSFWAADDKSWTKYMEPKIKSGKLPFVFIYDGGYYTDNGRVSDPMYNGLLKLNYPKDKIVFSKYEPGEHFMSFWRNIYAQFLEAMFTQDQAALKCGAPLEYKDKTKPDFLDEDESRCRQWLGYMVDILPNGNVDWNYHRHDAVLGEYANSGEELLNHLKQIFPDCSKAIEELSHLQALPSLEGRLLTGSNYYQMVCEAHGIDKTEQSTVVRLVYRD